MNSSRQAVRSLNGCLIRVFVGLAAVLIVGAVIGTAVTSSALIAVPVLILLAIPVVAKILFRGRRMAGKPEYGAELVLAFGAFVVGCLLTAPATWLSGVPMSEEFGGTMMAGIVTTGGLLWFAGDEMVLLAQRSEHFPLASLITASSLGMVLVWILITPPVISYAFGLSY